MKPKVNPALGVYVLRDRQLIETTLLDFLIDVSNDHDIDFSRILGDRYWIDYSKPLGRLLGRTFKDGESLMQGKCRSMLETYFYYFLEGKEDFYLSKENYNKGLKASREDFDLNPPPANLPMGKYVVVDSSLLSKKDVDYQKSIKSGICNSTNLCHHKIYLKDGGFIPCFAATNDVGIVGHIVLEAEGYVVGVGAYSGSGHHVFVDMQKYPVIAKFLPEKDYMYGVLDLQMDLEAPCVRGD